MVIGKINDLDGLKIDQEYPDLDCYKDFYVIEKLSQVKHDNGLIYDDLTYKLKPGSLHMTFSEYIIKERSEEFYFTSLEQMIKCKTTLEVWFKDMYYDYKILQN